MTTLVIDRQTLPATLLPLIGADRVRVERRAAEIVLTPIMADETDGINQNDYDNKYEAFQRFTRYRGVLPADFDYS